jgi:regulatory protein YycH of two-component signal transduction system YycFG
LKEIHPNLQDYKNVIIAYYILNDLLLGKVVEDKENKKELHQLESILQLLANNTNFKVDIDALKAILNMAIPENDLESFVEDTRAIFRQQLIQL